MAKAKSAKQTTKTRSGETPYKGLLIKRNRKGRRNGYDVLRAIGPKRNGMKQPLVDASEGKFDTVAEAKQWIDENFK